MNSQLFRLNLSDAQKAVLMAFLGPVILWVGSACQAILSNQPIVFDWQTLLKVSLASGISYLIKNFLSDTNGRVLGKIG